jgi:periplasmic protein TonB
MSLPTSLHIVTAGPVRAAAGGMRELAWTLVGNVAFHASLLAVASVIPVNTAAWMLSAVPHDPSSGDNTIQLTASFLDAAAASPKEQAEVAPTVVIHSLPVSTEGSSELAPRKFDISPRATEPMRRDAIFDAEYLEESASQSTAGGSETARREMLEQQPQVAEFPADSSSTPSRATAAVSSPRASGAPDVLPSEIHSPFPAYPPELLARRIQATVILRLRIAADGTLLEAAVHRTSGYEAMDQAALAGVKSWRFKPAISEGQSVESVVRKPFKFEIRE